MARQKKGSDVPSAAKPKESDNDDDDLEEEDSSNSVAVDSDDQASKSTYEYVVPKRGQLNPCDDGALIDFYQAFVRRMNRETSYFLKYPGNQLKEKKTVGKSFIRGVVGLLLWYR